MIQRLKPINRHPMKFAQPSALLRVCHSRPDETRNSREKACRKRRAHLTTETVKGAALTLEGVDNVEGCDSLALGVLSVGDGVTDDTLKEGLQNSTGLFVDHCKAC